MGSVEVPLPQCSRRVTRTHLPRAGDQVKLHPSLVHAITGILEWLGIPHEIKSETPCTENRNLRMNIVIRKIVPRSVPKQECRDKAVLLDETHVDPWVQIRKQGSRTDHDRSVGFISEARKRQHYPRPGEVPFNEYIQKLPWFLVESFGREGTILIDHLTENMAGGRGGRSLARKGICK